MHMLFYIHFQSFFIDISTTWEVRLQGILTNFGIDFQGLTPACALHDKQALALNELLDDAALTWIKAGADVKTFFE